MCQYLFIFSRGAPVQVELPMGATQVAAGGHHTVVLLSNGQVYTFGNHKVKEFIYNPSSLGPSWP